MTSSDDPVAPTPPPAPPARPARAPARTPARARRRDGVGAAGGSAAEPRWAGLWRRLAQARAELADHERRAGAIDALFRTTIEPRERLLTLGVARVTEALVDHYDGSPLERGERSVLGLWINENLGSLSGHPYAPADSVAALIERWRAVLDAAAQDASGQPDPFDPASPHYRTMPIRRDGAERVAFERDAISRYLSPRFERALRARDDGDERAGRPGPESGFTDGEDASSDAADEARGESANERPEGASRGRAHGKARGQTRERADAAASEPPVDGTRGDGAGGATGSAPGKLADAPEDDARALVERLFRRLARALHPDREQDSERRDVKHVLMSTALAARRARDLDTLLSLHAEHVGGELDAGEPDAELLARALERQLAGMRRALHRARVGDPFRADLLARYEGADDAARRRRVVAHATRLDDEIRRLERLVAALGTADGLGEALDDRREIERDRLTVDELTGL